MKSKRLIVGLSGASGQIYGIRLLEALRRMPDVEAHLVISDAARITCMHEVDRDLADVEALADVAYEAGDIGAPIASGSFRATGMVVVPCSIKSLSAIANSYAADLLARAADVQLKEGRPVVLVVRETPLHLGHLRLMVRAAEHGCTIMPPVPAFYIRTTRLDSIIDHTVGRILTRVGIDNTLYAEWSGLQE
jgi:4-hydroxy-3-polyprenylbenzoate decarboxylase